MPNRASASTALNVTPLKVKWTEEKVLREARTRTKEMFNAKATQSMLASLLSEAGWSNDEFIDALCRDVIQRGTH